MSDTHLCKYCGEYFLNCEEVVKETIRYLKKDLAKAKKETCLSDRLVLLANVIKGLEDIDGSI